MRREFFSPSIVDASDWNEWHEKGKPTAAEKAREKAKKIIESHSTPTLPVDVIRQIRETFSDIVMDVTNL